MGFFYIPLGHNPFILFYYILFYFILTSDTENVCRMDRWLGLPLIIHDPPSGRALVFQMAVATATMSN